MITSCFLGCERYGKDVEPEGFCLLPDDKPLSSAGENARGQSGTLYEEVGKLFVEIGLRLQVS